MVGVLWAVINFEVEVVTDVGQAVSPIIIFDPNSVGNIGESTGRCRTVAADWPLSPASLLRCVPPSFHR